MEFEDFEILLQHAEKGGYQVKVLRSEFGDATGPLLLSTELLEMLNRLDGLSQVNVDKASALNAQAVGAALFQALFPATVVDPDPQSSAASVQSLFDRAFGAADSRSGGLRIKIRFDLSGAQLSRFHALPWELVHSTDKDFLALDKRFSIVRYLDVSVKTKSVPLPGRLRILVVMANPAGAHPLDLGQERKALEKVFEQEGNIELEFLENPDPYAFHRRFAEGPWHVVHFMGHGNFDTVAGEGLLFLTGEDRAAIPVRGAQFGEWLKNGLPDLRLVVLNSCRSAWTAAPWAHNPFGGVAAALVRNGIPAVVAMQLPINDQVAIRFSESFYSRVAAGERVDVAATYGRMAIRVTDDATAKWATPVLYMRVENGHLFEPRTEKAKSDPKPDGRRLDRYLTWLIEQYSDLELPALGAGMSARVPLESVYVALRGDRSSSDERIVSQAQLEEEALKLENFSELQALSPQERSRFASRQVALIVRDPTTISLEERDRPQLFRSAEDRTISLGEAFRTERRMVILGDPGSGKTTLVRWLTLQLARAWQKGEERVTCSAHLVDPAAREDAPPFDLGLTRVPILVRVATFAAACKEDPGLSFARFLGHHLGSAFGRPASLANGEVLDPAELSPLLLSFLQEGRAVVLVDGLDEIGDQEDRHDISRRLDLFFDTWLRGTLFQPVREGGNQMVVTSRIVGYRMAPLKQEAAHLTIEPMQDVAIERFCSVWSRAVPPPGPPEKAEERIELEVEGLKRALAELKEHGSSELTSNPLLLTILALIYRSGQQTFPRQRVKLYEMAVKILLDTWRRRARVKGDRELADSEVLSALIPLAADIHENSAAGVVGEERLRQILSEHLQPSSVHVFEELVAKEVGLLTARGWRIFGFLHLTFQEYLAASYLIRNRPRVAEELLGRLASPRWREPILMALGKLSSELDSADFGRLLSNLLTNEDPLERLVPRIAFLLVAALPEMEVVPAGTGEKIAARLLAAYADRTRLERFPSLKEQIEAAWSRLAESQAGELAEVLCAALLNPQSGEATAAAANLALACRFYTPELAEALDAALPRDSEAWDWPVDRALRDLAGRVPKFLAGDRNSLRRRLLRQPDLAAPFTEDPAWRRLCLTIYGGLDSLLLERIAETRQEGARIKAEQELWNSKSQDPLYEENRSRLEKDLAESEARIKQLEKGGNGISVEKLYRDSAITPLVLSALKQGAPDSRFVAELWKLWHSAAEISTRGDALLALAALGESVDESLRGADPASRFAISRLSRILDSIRPAVVAVRTSAMNALGTLSESCPPDEWHDLVTALIRISVEVADTPLKMDELNKKVPPGAEFAVLAERWAYHLSGASEDSLYNVAVVLDTVGAELSNPPLLLAASLAACPRSWNARWDRHGWSLERLAPRPTDELDVLMACLDVLPGIPDPFDFVRGWALCRLAPLLREHGLVLEAFILALETLTDRFNSRTETLAVLSQDQPELAALVADPYPWIALRRMAAEVHDAHLKFRIYDRLARSHPELRLALLVESEANLSPSPGFFQQIVFTLWDSASPVMAESAEAAASAIRDAASQSRAFERLMALGNEGQRKKWLERARRAAADIEDPCNKALALARLSRHVPLAAGREMQEQAIEAAFSLATPRQQAQVLSELASLPGSSSLIDSRLRSSAFAQRAGRWLVALVNQSLAPHLLQYESQLRERQVDVAPLLLGAIASDLRRKFALPSDLAALWSALGGPLQQLAVHELRRRFRPSGLRLTGAAAAGLDQLVDVGDLQTFRELLELVDHPDDNVLSLLEEWRDLPGVAAHIDLLLAEAGVLSLRTIPTLLRLLEDPDDRIRGRTFVALHGTDIGPKLSVSGLGVDAVALLAREALANRESRPQVAQALLWTFERLRYNDGRAFEHWAKMVAEELPGHEEAAYILQRIHWLDSNSWPVFRKQFLHGQPKVQKALFRSLCTLLYKNRLSAERWSEIAKELSGLADVLGDDIRFVLNLPEAVGAAAAVVTRTCPALSDSEIAQAADRELELRRRSVAAVLREVRDPDALREQLIAIGSIRFVSDDYRRKIAKAAEIVDDEPAILDTLVAWLADWLEGDLIDHEGLFYKGSDLMGVTLAAAERHPVRFLNASAARPKLAQGIAEAAAQHNTFTGRQSALVLLSHLHRIHRHSLSALQAGLRDVVDVQEIVLQTVDRYREIDEKLLPELLEDLRDPSPAVAYTTSRMLASLARNTRLPASVRKAVIEALAGALETPESRRTVHVLVRDATEGTKIEQRGNLDETYFRLLSELVGSIEVKPQANPPRVKK